MNHANRKGAIESCIWEWHSLGFRTMKLGAAESYKSGIEPLRFVNHRWREVDSSIMPILCQSEHVRNRATVAEADLQHLTSRFNSQCGEDSRVTLLIGLVEPGRDSKTDFAIRGPELTRPLGATQGFED